MRPLLLAALLAVPARAGSPGAESFDFLSMDGGARPVAMGGAYTALSGDSNASLYNPAGYGLVRRHEATLMHNEYVEGVRQQFLGLTLRQGIGVHLNYLNYGGDIKRTTLANPDGVGTFGAHDMALGAGYGRSFGKWSFGAGGKYLSQSIDDVTARGWAVDLGAIYTAAPGVTLGASVLNLGPEVRYQHAKEKLPTMARAGLGYSAILPDEAGRLTAAVDVSKTRTDKPRAGAGLEYVLMKVLSLRGGWAMRNETGLGVTAGVGWRQDGFSVDYAFAPLGDVGHAHRVSLTLRWGEEKIVTERKLRRRWYVSQR